MAQKGNNVYDSSFLSILLKLKSSTMEATHVASLVKINSIDSGEYTCELFDGSQQIIKCLAIQNLSLQVGDICLVLFCDKDYKQTLRNYIATSNIIKQNTIEQHSLNNGIIVGLIYR